MPTVFRKERHGLCGGKGYTWQDGYTTVTIDGKPVVVPEQKKIWCTCDNGEITVQDWVDAPPENTVWTPPQKDREEDKEQDPEFDWDKLWDFLTVATAGAILLAIIGAVVVFVRWTANAITHHSDHSAPYSLVAGYYYHLFSAFGALAGQFARYCKLVWTWQPFDKWYWDGPIALFLIALPVIFACLGVNFLVRRLKSEDKLLPAGLLVGFLALGPALIIALWALVAEILRAATAVI